MRRLQREAIKNDYARSDNGSSKEPNKRHQTSAMSREPPTAKTATYVSHKIHPFHFGSLAKKDSERQ